MRSSLSPALLAGALLMLGGCSRAASAEMGDPAIGQPAPAFQGTDSDGKAQSLSAYKGKWVVLEWLNHGCPFVRKHYDSKNMQTLQKEMTDKGVVWLSIISSAEGKQGFSTPEKANADRTSNGASPTAIVLDAKGDIGRLYGARTTPHLFIIDPNGMLVYKGGIDDHASTDPDDIAGSTNYVRQALTEGMAGKPITVSASKPYGCSVKY
ncbi:MAG: thioredoxin family protein [Myxococcales bacterium]|nr:thioredoxin family protein [Myxococcales bacterium]